jgi:AraC family transcriptional activator of pobA
MNFDMEGKNFDYFYQMENRESFLDQFSQNKKLPIRIVSPGFGHVSPEVFDKYGLTHRKSYYFFLFMLDGCSRNGIDLEEVEIRNNELLFVLPHQVHRLPAANHGSDYFKLGFDESCLSLLPRQYPFLINPLNNQKISFPEPAAARLKAIFGMLLELLNVTDTHPGLILAHLNTLLTEIDTAYFAAGQNPTEGNLSKYIDFKVFVENHLTDHLSISQTADELRTNTNSLYQIVKHYSGMSPKEFINNRLIQEARRRLYYGESSTIKELAYELGFNDPEYFSRLFKKVTGKTINDFSQDLSGN